MTTATRTPPTVARFGSSGMTLGSAASTPRERGCWQGDDYRIERPCATPARRAVRIEISAAGPSDRAADEDGQRPSGVHEGGRRGEAHAGRRLERPELLVHAIDTPVPRPFDRPLRVRRAELEREVDVVGRCHAVAQRPVRLVRQRQSDAGRDRRGRERDVLAAPPPEARPRPDAMAGRVVLVEADAALATQAPRGHEPGLQRRGREPDRRAEARMDGGRGREVDVEPDQVDVLERPLGEAIVAHRAVDLLDRRGAALEQPQRLERERPVDAVDDEARRIRAPDRRLAPAGHDRLGPGRGAGVASRDRRRPRPGASPARG